MLLSRHHLPTSPPPLHHQLLLLHLPLSFAFHLPLHLFTPSCHLVGLPSPPSFSVTSSFSHLLPLPISICLLPSACQSALLFIPPPTFTHASCSLPYTVQSALRITPPLPSLPHLSSAWPPSRSSDCHTPNTLPFSAPLFHLYLFHDSLRPRPHTFACPPPYRQPFSTLPPTAADVSECPPAGLELPTASTVWPPPSTRLLCLASPPNSCVPSWPPPP